MATHIEAHSVKRTIVFYVIPDFSMIAFATAIEPLRIANRMLGYDSYRWRVASIDAGSVARWCVEQLAGVFPTSVDQLTLSFTSEEIPTAFYHYSHGLKKHDGNCQRIAHGHRSRIRIDLDGERNTELEQRWSERWADIYLGTREDLEREDSGQLHFAYDALQGAFALSIPQSRCEVLECDTTVEQLAQYIAETLAADQPGHTVTVRAYEGIGKGAVASARL